MKGRTGDVKASSNLNNV